MIKINIVCDECNDGMAFGSYCTECFDRLKYKLKDAEKKLEEALREIKALKGD